MIDIQKVQKIYGKEKVLKEVTHQFADGKGTRNRRQQRFRQDGALQVHLRIREAYIRENPGERGRDRQGL